MGHPLPKPLMTVPSETTAQRPRRSRSTGYSPWATLMGIVVGGAFGTGVAVFLVTRTNLIDVLRGKLEAPKEDDHPAGTKRRTADDSRPSQPRKTNEPGPRRTSTPAVESPARPLPPPQTPNPPTSSLPPSPVPADSPSIAPAMPPGLEPEQRLQPNSSAATRPGHGVDLPPLHDTSPIPVASIDEPFEPSRLHMLWSAVATPDGAAHDMVATAEGATLRYRDSTASDPNPYAKLRCASGVVRFAWLESNVGKDVRTQVRNAVFVYQGHQKEYAQPLRRAQTSASIALDLRQSRVERQWTIEAPPAGEWYLDYAPPTAWPRGGQFRGAANVKVGAKAIVHFPEFKGAQATFLTIRKGNHLTWSCEPEFVEPDGDRFDLTFANLEATEAKWRKAIETAEQKSTQLAAQAESIRAAMDELDPANAANEAQAAGIVAQKRAANQKLVGIQTRMTALAKSAGELMARVEGVPAVRQTMTELDGVAVPGFVVYVRCGNHRVELFRHEP